MANVSKVHGLDEQINGPCISVSKSRSEGFRLYGGGYLMQPMFLLRQIAVMIQAADALVANTSTSGLQSAAERAAMISSTVSSELIETIEAAITAAGGASAAAVDVTSAAFVNEILSETVIESSAKILAVVQAKQASGELDLSDTSSASVAAILRIKEAAEVVGQTGLSADQLSVIT